MEKQIQNKKPNSSIQSQWKGQVSQQANKKVNIQQNLFTRQNTNQLNKKTEDATRIPNIKPPQKSNNDLQNQYDILLKKFEQAMVNKNAQDQIIRQQDEQIRKLKMDLNRYKEQVRRQQDQIMSLRTERVENSNQDTNLMMQQQLAMQLQQQYMQEERLYQQQIQQMLLQQVQQQQNQNNESMTYEELLNLQDQIGYVSRGLSDHQIQIIPKVLFQANDQNNDKCGVCFDDYQKNELVKKLNCDHLYHPTCIDQWLKQEKTCPICKKEQV